MTRVATPLSMLVAALAASPLPAQVEAFSRDLADHALPEEDYTRFLESICGTTDDSQPVEQYDGSLGVTTAFVDTH